MKIDLGDYRIESDERQFVVQAKKVIEKGRLTKEENVGKEFYKPVGYYSNIKSALKYLSNKIVLDNVDINTVINKLKSLESKIESLNNILEVKEDIETYSKEDRKIFLDKIEEIEEEKGDYSNGYLVEDLFPEAELVKERIIGESRWSKTKVQVYKFRGMYLEVCWEDPATEMQDGQETYLEVREVKAVKEEVINFR
ncbi:MAG: hypothetical protein RR192_03120 [Peptostreptococcaceae bacterium]